MTPIDLRIKYRFETGCSPTYGKSETIYYEGISKKDEYNLYNYQNGLTHLYAQWLEESMSKQVNTKKRDYFLKDTGTHATYYDKDKNIRYTKAYKEWLEERICQAYTVLEKLKK